MAMQGIDGTPRQGLVRCEEVGQDLVAVVSAVVQHRNRAADELRQLSVLAEQKGWNVLHPVLAVHQKLVSADQVVHLACWHAEILGDVGDGKQLLVGKQGIEFGVGRSHTRHLTRESARVRGRGRAWAILEDMTELAVGDYLDNRYVIDRPIARGGMSTVFRCVDVRLGREVAAKVMDERYVRDELFLTRFQREARAMAQLSHPNLVNVYDFSHLGDHVFLIMELIRGGTLGELLAERGPMPPHAAAAVMRGALTGLSIAHRKSMVHRDIKPDNILINDDHRVKLADFGLVRAAADATHSTDQIVGTVSYLSPEQVDGSSMTQASDVYSAGIVLFELLTGTVPFHGDTPLAHAYARLNQDVPAPSSRIQGVPKLFDELVATATARHPRDRFMDAGEFLAALDDVAGELGLPDYVVPVPANSAANRAAAHPTSITALPPRDIPRDKPEPPTRTFEQRLFPAVSDSTRVVGATEPPQPPAVPAAGPVPTPAPAQPSVPAPAPAARPPQERGVPRPQAVQPPPPISNRGGVGTVLFILGAAVLILFVALGAWWFGSGMYGEIPALFI